MVNIEFKKVTCPTIVLKGWWWKKYIPHYQKLSKVMNDLQMDYWINKGGYEEYMKILETNFIKEVFDNSYKTYYIHQK